MTQINQNKPTSDTVASSNQLLDLLMRTTHQLHSQFESHLVAQDLPPFLTGPRLRFLLQVEEAGQLHMNIIAERLGIKPRTVTQFVDAMEREQLILRLPDPHDRRATYVMLTEHAPALLERAKLAMNQSADLVMGPLSEQSKQQLQHILLALMTTTSK